MAIRHAFVSEKVDGSDPTLVRPSNWNDAHTIEPGDLNTVLYGSVNPTTEGVNGDFYINTVTHYIFGPKASGAWPEGTSIVGPKGDKGDQGLTGSQGIPGKTPAQTLVCAGVAALTWSNMPLAATFFGGANRNSMMIDLTGYTQVRFSAIKLATAGATASKLILRYYTSYSTTVGNYLDIGTSEVSVAVNVQNQLLQTAWIDLATGAKANISISIVGSGGDGALDPQFGNIWAEFK